MAPATKSTPKSRINLTGDPEKKYKLAKRSVLVVRRVEAASPSGRRCVVMNQPNVRISKTGVQLCHCFGRANSLNDSNMKSLEFAWGMTRNSLNLDSRRNCFFCISNFHKMFDEGMWGFMPELEVVDRYHAAWVRDNGNFGFELAKEIEHDKEKVHSYTLVAFHTEMEETDIDYHNENRADGAPKKTTYEYPFTDLPKIKSHLHPKFVLLSIGYQLYMTTNISIQHRHQEHIQPYAAALKKISEMTTDWWKEFDPVNEFHPAFASTISFDDIRQAERVELVDNQGPIISATSTSAGGGLRKSSSVANLGTRARAGGGSGPKPSKTTRLRKSRTSANLKEDSIIQDSTTSTTETSPPKTKLTIVIRLGGRIAQREVTEGEKDDEDEDQDQDDGADDTIHYDDIPDTDDEGENRCMFQTRSKKRVADPDSSPDVSPPPSPTTVVYKASVQSQSR
ncbi:hypothetical protein CVT24_012886 [Panaeolus cyanescens]|uniref:HNH nuclease domain-containing protein n=1 Tax=Panaeolus cyanescens TaxID=181874 RepID=A0A409W2T9_9AGAR|nr:hypothetical protein CVT24_012886 [Panaeolus cyanescens]